MPGSHPNYLNLEYFFYKIYEWFLAVYHYFTSDGFISLMKTILKIIIILLITGIIYGAIRIEEIRAERRRKLLKVPMRDPSVGPTNDRWEAVKKHIAADTPAEWKLGIIEADLILDEIVAKIRPDGENLGERLKKIDPSQFTTLQDAWEAHKVRNRIAHEGSAFTISRPEAKRIIGLYENVFREFKYI